MKKKRMQKSRSIMTAGKVDARKNAKRAHRQPKAKSKPALNPRKRKIYFVTRNNGKLKEVRKILKPFGIEVFQIKDDKPELQDTLHNIVKFAAKSLAEKHKRPVVVEDTGFFFEAYRDFPGPLIKPISDAIGFDGLFKLLEGKKRNAYFQAVVGYCRPGEEPVLFEGTLKGMVSTEPCKGGHCELPHDQIFIANGYDKPLSTMMEEKNRISHRKIAFEKLGRWLR